MKAHEFIWGALIEVASQVVVAFLLGVLVAMVAAPFSDNAARIGFWSGVVTFAGLFFVFVVLTLARLARYVQEVRRMRAYARWGRIAEEE